MHPVNAANELTFLFSLADWHLSLYLQPSLCSIFGPHTPACVEPPTSDGLVWQRPREKGPRIFGRITLLSELNGTRMNKIIKQGPLMFWSKIDWIRHQSEIAGSCWKYSKRQPPWVNPMRPLLRHGDICLSTFNPYHHTRMPTEILIRSDILTCCFTHGKPKPLEDLSGTWNGQLNKVCGHFLEVTTTTTTTL